jgi:hypothetical protein
MTQITSFTDYFREERDIYVQNISSYNVVVNFDVGNGQSSSYTFIPSRDPVNLTMTIPFRAIANSTEFRRMINRKPSVLRLITHDEFMAHYERRAAASGLKTADEAISAALEKIANRGEPTADTPTPEPISSEPATDMNGKLISEEEVINPRVLHLCLQVHSSVPEPQKMSAQDMLNELEVLSSSLKFDDWEYVFSHGYYKSVKNYAKQERDKSAKVELDDTQTTKAKKPTKPKAKKQADTEVTK